MLAIGRLRNVSLRHIYPTVCTSQLKKCWRGFHETSHWAVLPKSINIFQLWLKLDNNGEPTLRPTCISARILSEILTYLAIYLLQKKMLQTKIIEKSERYFMPSKLFCMSNVFKIITQRGVNLSEVVTPCLHFSAFLMSSQMKQYNCELRRKREIRWRVVSQMANNFFVYFYPTLKLM
jgi:hypothetical protein